MKDRLSLSIAGLVILLLVITLAKRETATAQASDQTTKPSTASAIFTINTTFVIENDEGNTHHKETCYVDEIKGDWIHCGSKGSFQEWYNTSQLNRAYPMNKQ
jgi:putative salt-induced outer membrane protein YdiY